MTWDLAKLFDSHNAVVVELPSGGKFQVYLNDGYWSRLFINGFSYEPDVAHVLRRVFTQADTYFLDCGANLGYWSVFASQLLPSGRVLALEASPPQYERLLQNAKLNAGSFEAILGAIWSRDNDELVIVTHDQRHAGASVVNRREKVGQDGYHEYKLQSITIETICNRHIPNKNASVVIKLDVEDAEIQALEGARGVISSRDVLILYEDHGQDPTCHISDYLLNNFEFQIFHCDDQGALTRMNSIPDIKNVKKHKSSGYNFCACSPNSAFSKILAG